MVRVCRGGGIWVVRGWVVVGFVVSRGCGASSIRSKGGDLVVMGIAWGFCVVSVGICVLKLFLRQDIAWGLTMLNMERIKVSAF